MNFQSLIFQDITKSSSTAIAGEGHKVVGFESVIDAIIETLLEIFHVII